MDDKTLKGVSDDMLEDVAGGLEKDEEKFFEQAIRVYKADGRTMDELLAVVDEAYSNKPGKWLQLQAFIQSRWETT